MMRFSGNLKLQRGFSLLEVLVAVVIFAVGLLAIASLQGSLMESGSDAKARSVGTSLAQAEIEELRTFLEEDDYEALAGGTESITEGGVEFQRQTQITDYYYSESGTLEPGTNPDTGKADAKLATVTVSWCDAAAGSACDPTDPTTDPNTVVVEDVVSRSMTPVGSAKALSELTPSDPPRVPYTPGEAPSTISIDLEDGSKKESPQPTLETTRGGSTDSEAEKVNTVTRLESITYNTLASGEVTVQRQEFLATNCTCQFGANTSDNLPDVGHTPVFWDGTDWVGRKEDPDKPVGHFPNDSNLGTQVNVLCNLCCRDHHDSADGTTVDHDDDSNTPEVQVAKFNPFRDSANTGDHDHFDGSLSSPVTSGSYLEACRFARVDGNFQITSDFRLESLQVLPGTTDALPQGDPGQPFNDWIGSNDPGNETGYRLYVKDFVELYAQAVAEGTVNYPSETPQQEDPATAEDEILPNGDETRYGSRTSPVDGESDPGLPSFDDVPSNNETRQLVGRAIYMDYLHPVLQDRINCRLGNLDPDNTSNCDGGEADTSGDGRDASGEPLFPILPFFEVNIALQANWAVIRDNLVAVTDEPVASTADTTYSRGAVTIDDSNAADSDVVASIEQGNVGLTDTHDITPFDCTDPSRLTIDRLTYEGPGSNSSSITVSGCLDVDPFLIENDVIAPSDVTVTDPFGDDCGTALGDNFFECELKQLVSDNGTNTVTVSNYSTNQTNVKVCLGPLADGSFAGGTVSNDGQKSETTVFDFGVKTSSVELTMFIEEQSGSAKNCPQGQLK